MKYNNAESTLSADITASGTSIVLKTGEGALFPSTGYPEKMKIEHFEGGIVTKREVITISWRTGDILTISSRASEACVQDESLATKTRTQNAFSFSSGDTISMTITEDDFNGVIDTLNTTIPNTYATKDEVKKSELVYWASSTGTDDYAITVSWITAYQDGMTFRVKSDVANTGACTLDVNGIGAKAVKKQQWTVDLTDGDWAANWIATLVYNSSLDVWQYASQEAVVVTSAVSSTSSDFVCGESISAGDALYVDSTDWKAYLTDASDSNKTNFIGFAKSSGVLDDIIWVDTAGVSDGFTWLEIWKDYFLDWWQITRNDLSNATYTWNSKSFTEADSWIEFSQDWTKCYIVDDWWANINQYNLSTPFDISTAWSSVFDFSVSWQDINPVDVTISVDWTKLYILWNSNDRIYEYNLSTPFQLSSISYSWNSFSITSFEALPRGISLSSDWTKMFFCWQNQQRVKSLTLSTPYNITTASIDTWKELQVSANGHVKCKVSKNWDYIYITLVSSSIVYQYNLTTPFDLSTATNQVTFDMSWQFSTTYPYICLSSDWENLYWGLPNIIYQYSIKSVWPVTKWWINTEAASWQIVKIWKAISNTSIEIDVFNNNWLTWVVSTTATTWSVVLWNAEWYIIANVPWLWNIKIPYYNI